MNLSDLHGGARRCVVLAALLAVVLAYGCGGKVVLDPRGAGAGGASGLVDAGAVDAGGGASGPVDAGGADANASAALEACVALCTLQHSPTCGWQPSMPPVDCAADNCLQDFTFAMAVRSGCTQEYAAMIECQLATDGCTPQILGPCGAAAEGFSNCAWPICGQVKSPLTGDDCTFSCCIGYACMSDADCASGLVCLPWILDPDPDAPCSSGNCLCLLAGSQ